MVPLVVSLNRHGFRRPNEVCLCFFCNLFLMFAKIERQKKSGRSLPLP